MWKSMPDSSAHSRKPGLALAAFGEGPLGFGGAFPLFQKKT